ncbi:recombination regulator RecX [Aerococcaceae bacterium DSM 111021]|nr:recombination regulator RecX [Aerococcaceae bacterium DSM 111021]
MKITKISQQQKQSNRYSLFIDEEFFIGVDQEILIKYALHKDQVVDQDLLDKVKSAENDHKLYSAAINYLSYGMRSIKEMRDYLNKQKDKKENYDPSEEVIEETLERLIRQGYLNDLEYAKSYVRTNYTLKSKGPTVIQNELKVKKGINEMDILEALDEYPVDEQSENIQKLAEKFIRTKKSLPPKMMRNKLYTHLISKGFDKDIVNQHMSELTFEEAVDNQVEMLEKEAEKYLRKHQRRFSGYDLKQKITQGLLGKGYDYEFIKIWLEDNEQELEK